MRIYLSHITALEAWRCWSAQPEPIESTGATKHDLPTRSKITTPSPSESATLGIIDSCPILKGALSSPVHVVVSPRSGQRSGSKVVYHRSKCEYPGRPFRQLEQTVFLCSPELTFVQLAETLSIPKLVSLGYEMCGRYPADEATRSVATGNDEKVRSSESRSKTEPDNFASASNRISKAGHRTAITSANKLASFSQRAHGAHGSKKARRAAAYVIDGSASPMETAIAMELTLPYLLGGRAMPKPILNHRIELSADASIIARRKHLVFDLYWPECNLAVEYDSRMHHEEKSARIADSRKRDAAAAMGIQIVSITERQYLNMLEFDEITKAIAAKLGHRIKPHSGDYRQRVFWLRSELRHLYRPGK